jgi:hypothetical protein
MRGGLFSLSGLWPSSSSGGQSFLVILILHFGQICNCFPILFSLVDKVRDLQILFYFS